VKVYNFNSGPATLPADVINEAAGGIKDIGDGLSILEVSHRGKAYSAIHEEAVALVKELLNVPDSHAVLFLQGGASFQFAMAPMNLAAGKAADYIVAGHWGTAAFKEAKLVCDARAIADTSSQRPAAMPDFTALKATPGAAYLHLTSNETISGTQMKAWPKSAVPIIADMSSDILSRDVNVADCALVYAGAQKNLGPAGVTLAIVRKDLAAAAPKTLPAILRYQTHIESNSLYNTAPCFAIYVVMLALRWAKKQGGIPALAQKAQAKAKILYDVFDSSTFYRGVADKKDRSLMNVTFALPTEELEKAFAKEAETAGLVGLAGHRSVGGLRASIYNAMEEAGVKKLADFMKEFEKKKSAATSSSAAQQR
jgi:phosphoserine aminotransferase